MNIAELLAEQYARNLGMLKASISDFSEEEMFFRPCPAANHAAWQIGHLIVAEANMVNAAAPGRGGKIPPEFVVAFSKDMASSDERSRFPSKDALLACLDTVRAASICWAKDLSEADIGAPGPENMRAFIPTKGSLSLIILEHLAMHLGQLQVIRRCLGKAHLM
jgi:hypothetical protein